LKFTKITADAMFFPETQLRELGVDGDHAGLDADHAGLDGDHAGLDGDHAGLDGDHAGLDGDPDLDGDPGLDGDRSSRSLIEMRVVLSHYVRVFTTLSNNWEK
jgi:hypothetical protein